MFTIIGRYATAVVYALQLEGSAESQIMQLCDQEYAKDANIRIMPDAHAGVGCVIGTTLRVNDKVAPALVGVDIGCGMEAIKLSKKSCKKLSFLALDDIIRQYVPSGFEIRSRPHALAEKLSLESLHCSHLIDLNRARLSVGTLGGGNHFIELDKGEDGETWLVIHSGSRHTGLVVSEIYRRLAEVYCAGVSETELLDLFYRFSDKSENAKRDNLTHFVEITKKVRNYAEKKNDRIVPRELSYIEGELMSFYMQDMEIMTQYAELNRQAIADEILSHMSWDVADRFTTIHNFISDGVLRKGAVPAIAGKRFLLPMNMRDGALICVGKGNPEWNWSCAHGAGRVMSRGDAKRNLSMEKYQETMNGIYTTCISQETLDEAPDAYKPIGDILNAISNTADVVEHLRSIYNFKAGKE